MNKVQLITALINAFGPAAVSLVQLFVHPDGSLTLVQVLDAGDVKDANALDIISQIRAKANAPAAPAQPGS